jgi:hypothetical protein
MTYLVAFIIFVNGSQITLPIVVHASMQTCETARAKIVKEFQRDYKDARISSVCLDR